jgi:hypothetical protein
MNSQTSKIVKEGLRKSDLKDLVYPQLQIDTFKSKMGEDSDVCVVTLQAKDRSPARDLMEFIEKSYDFVLDADISAGENSKGEYSIFVEIERTPAIAEQIIDMLYGVKNLTDLKEFDFSYYKTDQTMSVTKENLDSIVPKNGIEYNAMINERRVQDATDFFDKTFMDHIEIQGNMLSIFKPFGNRIDLEVVSEGTVEEVTANIQDPIVENGESTAEMFWLTKVLGDYNITKYGDNFLLTNGKHAKLIKRGI